MSRLNGKALILEQGEEQLMKNLTSIWDDIVYRKMYINGACGDTSDTSPFVTTVS